MKYITQLSVVFALASAVFSAPGQTTTTNIILQTDFDGDAGQGNYITSASWVFAGTGAGSPLPIFINYYGVTNGMGVGGSSNYIASPDYTDLGTDPGWLGATGWAVAEIGSDISFAPLNPVTSISPLNSMLSSLVLTAQCKSSGLVAGQYGANVQISALKFYDGSGNELFEFQGYGVWASASSYSQLSVPLSNLTFVSGDSLNPVSDLTNAAVVATLASCTVEFEVNALLGTIGGTGANQLMPVFGFTDTGAILIDNIALTQIVITNTAPPPPPTPTVEQTVWQADYDSTFPDGGGYGFSGRDGTPSSAVGVLSTNLTGGVGNTASLEYTVDLSSWSGSPPVNYSDFGVGVAEIPLPIALASSSAASYRVYLSAKVGGTSVGVASVPGNVDLSFFTPLGQQVMDMTESVTLSNTWQSFVLTNLQVATWNTAFQQLFNQNYNTNVNKSELQITVPGSPNVGTVFGYDANNTVDIDSIKVVQLVPGLAPATIVQNNGQTKVMWADPRTGGTAKLQSATNVAGPYLDVAGAASAAASPYTVPSGSQQQFFRTAWVP